VLRRQRCCHILHILCFVWVQVWRHACALSLSGSPALSANLNLVCVCVCMCLCRSVRLRKRGTIQREPKMGIGSTVPLPTVFQRRSSLLQLLGYPSPHNFFSRVMHDARPARPKDTSGQQDPTRVSSQENASALARTH
jgi:hypothetical protein